jgi:hypothetical protein
MPSVLNNFREIRNSAACSMSEPYGYTIFCDDIREEVGGKITYVGTYQKDLILNVAFPAVLPQLCFGITYASPRELAREMAGMEIRVYLPGDPEDTPTVKLQADPEVAPDLAAPDQPVPALSILEGPQQTRAAFFVRTIGPVLKTAGHIRVRALLKSGRVVYLGALVVKSNVQATPSATSTVLPPPSEQSPSAPS